MSYSCTGNMASVISGHNAKILAPPPEPDKRMCNCRGGRDCPLGGKCLASTIVYKATVTSDSRPTRYYYGLCETTFKERYGKHTCSFRNREYCEDTELSKYIWSLKDSGIVYQVKWDIHR